MTAHFQQATTWPQWGAAAHSWLENGQGPRSPGQHSRDARTKTLGPRLPRALTLGHPTACSTALGSGLLASWGLTLTLGWPPMGPSQGAWRHNAGDWGPPSDSARLTLPPSHHKGGSGPRHSFSTGKRAGHSEHLATFEAPPRQNHWAQAPPPQRPHRGLPLRSPHSLWLCSADLLGAKPNPRLAPEWPFPRGMAPHRWGLGTTGPQSQTHTASWPPPGPIGAPPLIQGGRTGMALRALGDIRVCMRQNPWFHAPPAQRPHFGPPLCSPHSHRLRPPGLLGANPNPRLAPRGPSHRAWHCKGGYWGPPSRSARLTCLQAATRVHQGPTAHSGWEKGQSPPRPRGSLKALV